MATSTVHSITPRNRKGGPPIPFPQAQSDRRRYRVRVITSDHATEYTVSAALRDSMLEQGPRYGCTVEDVPPHGTRPLVDIGAYRARKTAQRRDDISFLERMATSPLVWPGGKGPRLGTLK